MSYRRKHIKNKIHKIKPKKSILKRPVFWILILSAALLVAGSYFLFFYDKIQVKIIDISGNEKISSDQIRQIAEKDINKKMAYFFNSKSIFLVDEEKIKSDVLDKFPEIGEIDVVRNFPQTVKIVVAERKPFLVYCDKGNNCYYVDKAGVAFKKAEDASGFAIVRQTLDNGEVFTGETIIGQNIMEAVSKIEKDLKDNFKIDLAEALVSTPVRMDVKTGENWQIYFNLDENSDINLQITKLNLLLSSQISEQDRKKLEYIDLRFDRAYYK